MVCGWVVQGAGGIKRPMFLNTFSDEHTACSNDLGEIFRVCESNHLTLS